MDLEETSRLMRKQDNRMTQYPLFVVQSLKRIYHVEDAHERERKESEYLDEDLLCDSCRELEDLDNECDDCDRETYHWYKEEYEINDGPGVFLTEKACEAHIKSNHYHYNKPRSYVISAWRNPEMVAVMQSILKLTGDEIPSHYK